MSNPNRFDDEPSYEQEPLDPSTDAFLNAAFDGDMDGAAPASSPSQIEVDFADRPAPRISIEAFCELEETRRLISSCASDRRLARTHVTVLDGGLSAAIERFHDNATPNLVIVESGMRGKGLFDQLDELANVCDPDTKVVVIGAVNDISLYRELVKRGVNEYLVPPISPVQFMRAVSGLYTDPAAPFYGKTVAFIGAKGGSGSSTIAHNTAWCIAEALHIDTTIVDFDLSFGTAALDFNQEVSTGIADALIQPDRVDDVLLERLLTSCGERLSLFAAPAAVDRDFDFHAEACESVIDALRRTVPVVVLDIPHQWPSWLRSTINGADEVIITATPDLACLRNAKHLFDMINGTRPNDAAPKLIINQTGLPKRPEIPVKDFADAMGVEPTLVLPFDAAVFGAAANNGQMIAEMAADSKVAEGLIELAARLTGRDPPVRKKTLVQRMLKRA
jgi:pilus assembly protein CpaE